MYIEISADHRERMVYEKELVILRRYPVLMIRGEWILFADQKDGRMEILAAKVTFDEQGCIASFDRHLTRDQWHVVHKLWQEYEREHRAGG